MMIKENLEKIGNTKIGKKYSFLDIGCGEGFVLDYFSSIGWKVTGIDFSSYGVEKNNPKMLKYLLKGDCDEILPKLINEGYTYDVINMDAFLDMSLNPENDLDNCRKLLKKNGILVIKVANNYSKLQLHLLETGKLKKEYWLDEGGHPSYFGKESLKKFVESKAVSHL